LILVLANKLFHWTRKQRGPVNATLSAKERTVVNRCAMTGKIIDGPSDAIWGSGDSILNCRLNLGYC